ncbi:MAG: GNAT family N-acetyltransferase [Anaerolineae bacterium]|nr:GNAT family N-acetyltransferase [Anaerolineae bacterium]
MMFDTQELKLLRILEPTITWHIREAQLTDAPALMQYCEMMAQQTPNNTSLRAYLLPETVDGYHDLIVTYVNHANSTMFVVVDQDKIVGMIKVTGNDHPLTGHIVELSINIHPDYQGQRIGSALMDKAIDWSKAHLGIRRIQLDVLAHNTDAIRFYERRGFCIEGFRHRAYHLHDVDEPSDFDAFTMGLVL